MDHILAAPPTGWGARMLTFWLHTNVAGQVNAAGTETTAGNATWRAHVDSLVSKASAANAYVLFVWAFDNPTGSHNKLIDAGGKATLRYLARRFTGNPAVIFAVQAEPPGGIGITWNDLKVASEDTIDEIRAEYADALVGIPGLSWSQRVASFAQDPVERENIFVKPHLYDGRVNGFTMENTIVVSGAEGVWNAGWPIVVGECGWGGRSNDVDMGVLFDYAEAHSWGWQAWALTRLAVNASGGCPCMSDGPIPPEGNLTPWGILARDTMVAWDGLADPDPLPVPVSDAPGIESGPGALLAVEDGVIRATEWADWSWGSTLVEQEPGATRVTHQGTDGGFQLVNQVGTGLFNWTDREYLQLLINATAAQLAALGVYAYFDQVGDTISTEVFLDEFATDQGDDWWHILIPKAEFGLSNQDTARLEIRNRSGAAMSPYRVHTLAVTRQGDDPRVLPADEPVPAPPAITIPASAERLTQGQTLHWVNQSYGTSVTPFNGILVIEHTASIAGFQLANPSGLLDLAGYASIVILAHGTPDQLDGLRLVAYRTHGPSSGQEALVGPPLTPYATDLGNGWARLDIPLSVVGFTDGDLARLEVENRSGAPMEPYRVADWAIIAKPVATTITVTVEPQDTDARESIGGPPTVRVDDQDGNPMSGVQVTAFLNQNSFMPESVTVETTDEDGLAVFDSLFIETVAVGYQLEFSATP